MLSDAWGSDGELILEDSGMNEKQRKSNSADVPFGIDRADRIPVQRYFDPEFYALERERLWSRVWQMACRLEEIPNPGDYSVYDIFDQSIIITRVDAHTVKAYHNACRHRGVQLVQDRGSAPDGFTCPFHGWQWKTDGKCKFVFSPNLFEKDQLRGHDLSLRECRLETWGGCLHRILLRRKLRRNVIARGIGGELPGNALFKISDYHGSTRNNAAGQVFNSAV